LAKADALSAVLHRDRAAHIDSGACARRDGASIGVEDGAAELSVQLAASAKG
jgi:hypothetical protein